jgi:hypothetical protein
MLQQRPWECRQKKDRSASFGKHAMPWSCENSLGKVDKEAAMRRRMQLIAMLSMMAVVGIEAARGGEPADLPLQSLEGLELIHVQGQVVEHQGRRGLRLSQSKLERGAANLETLALVSGVVFENGTIEVELSGEPAPDAGEQARGFVGLAFRVQATDPGRYECIYLRPTNGRAAEQIRRNHAVQYVSHPEFPWHRLRRESPGVYETYVDLVPGEWTKIRIEVAGQEARLYVHEATQPTLVVQDLKHGLTKGGVALWLHASTVAHFRNLVIRPAGD